MLFAYSHIIISNPVFGADRRQDQPRMEAFDIPVCVDTDLG